MRNYDNQSHFIPTLLRILKKPVGKNVKKRMKVIFVCLKNGGIMLLKRLIKGKFFELLSPSGYEKVAFNYVFKLFVFNYVKEFKALKFTLTIKLMHENLY